MKYIDRYNANLHTRNALKAKKTAAKVLRKLKQNPNAPYATKQSWKYHLARAMKFNPTKCEAILGDALMDARIENNWQIRNQAQIGPYIVDFLLDQQKVIIEADGFSHSKRKDYDLARDSYLLSKGYRTLRLTNEEIRNDISGCLTKIKAFI